MDDPESSAAWQDFANALGTARALFLARSGSGDPAWAEKMTGRIAALPSRVSLFARLNGDTIALGDGGEIPPNNAAARSEIAYTIDAVEPGGWMSDFQRALDLGMGVKLTNSKHVETAIKADWIIAVGMTTGENTKDIVDLIDDLTAHDAFSILSQDTPTNNTVEGKTPLNAFRHAPVDYLRTYNAPKTSAIDNAAILAEALGIEESTFKDAAGAEGQDLADAQAMVRVIAPVLLDESLDGFDFSDDLDINDVSEILGAVLVARGALPALRFGKNPYGVVTISDNQTIKLDEASGFSENEVQVLGRFNQVANIYSGTLINAAQQSAPRLVPGDGGGALAAILQQARVSRRLDISDSNGEFFGQLGCPHVAGRAQNRQPQSYLADLREKELNDLPDPTEKDRSWPLLYRLARVSLIRNAIWALTLAERVKASDEREGTTQDGDARANVARPWLEDIAKFEGLPRRDQTKQFHRFDNLRRGSQKLENADTRTPLRVARRLRSFDHALAHLAAIAARPRGLAQLETLMFETMDMLNHRVDAWATGVAYARLKKRREAGIKGLQAGYFGMLGALRDASQTAPHDGYIQAPSTGQATTAAILRSAYLRHIGEGAFNLDLGSGRVLGAMRLLNQMIAGLPMAVGLGLAVERRLRDSKNGHMIPDFRKAFPMKASNEVGPARS